VRSLKANPRPSNRILKQRVWCVAAKTIFTSKQKNSLKTFTARNSDTNSSKNRFQFQQRTLTVYTIQAKLLKSCSRKSSVLDILIQRNKQIHSVARRRRLLCYNRWLWVLLRFKDFTSCSLVKCTMKISNDWYHLQIHYNRIMSSATLRTH
jgi:hypothetical protein